MSTVIEPKTICIDFDQTLCNSAYPELGPPKPGAREALLAFRSMGFRIVISSCRSCSYNWELYYPDTPFVPAHERPVHTAMLDWLREHDMPFDEVDDGTKGKVSASYYLDDKAIRYEDNWPEVVSKVRDLENANASQSS